MSKDKKDVEEKDDKSKKLFSVTYIIWDDGEIDAKLVEYRKIGTGRGAPEKWTLYVPEFRERVEELLGDFDAIQEDMNNKLKAIANPNEVTPSVVPVSPLPKAEFKKKTDKKKDDKEKDDVDNLNFGDFDNNKPDDK